MTMAKWGLTAEQNFRQGKFIIYLSPAGKQLSAKALLSLWPGRKRSSGILARCIKIRKKRQGKAAAHHLAAEVRKSWAKNEASPGRKQSSVQPGHSCLSPSTFMSMMQGRRWCKWQGCKYRGHPAVPVCEWSIPVEIHSLLLLSKYASGYTTLTSKVTVEV